MKPATASTVASLSARESQHGEPARVEGVLDGGDQRREGEPERDGGAAQHRDGQGDLGLGIPQCQQRPAGGRHRADQQDEAEDRARDVSAVTAQPADEECDPQSENVCSHSRPSTSLSPPASSMKRCSSVSSPRTSSIVPSAST